MVGMDITLQNLAQGFEKAKYIWENNLLTTIYLVLILEKPLLIEGAPGVGKTEVAKVLSRIFQTELIRLQSERIGGHE